MRAILQYLHDVLYLLGSDKRKLPLLILSFLVLSLLETVGVGLVGAYVSLLVGSGVDSSSKVINSLASYMGVLGIQSNMFVVGVLLLSLFLVKAVFGFLVNRFVVHFSFYQSVRLRVDLIESYQNLQYETFVRRNSAEYIQATHSYTGQYSSSLNTLLKLISESVIVINIVILLYLVNSTALFLLIGIYATTFLIYDRTFREPLKVAGKVGNEENIVAIQGIQEAIQGLKEIRVLGLEKYFREKIKKGSSGSAKYFAKAVVIQSLSRYMFEVALIMFVCVLVGINELSDGNLESLVPVLGMIGVAAVRLIPAASMVTNGVADLRFNRFAITRLCQDINRKYNTIVLSRKVSDAIKVPPFRKIQLNRIQYRYPDSNNWTLNNVSIQFCAGDSIGLMGPSGSGKTTLMDILLGILKPQEGEILCNGESIDEINSNWKSYVAYLPQETFLIDDTVRRNVALGVPDYDIDESKITASLRHAMIASTVDELENGVETLLGERGVRLSGGQRQRIAIARAFYHDREVLVMDESMSALDSDTEEEILKQIEYIKGNKTTVVIAHRLSTLKHCDYIYRLKEGCIVKMGSYEEFYRDGQDCYDSSKEFIPT